MKNKNIRKDSIVNSELFKKYKEELAEEHDFSSLDKEISEKSKKETNLGRS